MQLTLENSVTSRVLRSQDALNNIGQAAFESLNEYELAAMQYVYAKDRITVGELSGLLGRSVKVSRPTLKGLPRFTVVPRESDDMRAVRSAKMTLRQRLVTHA